MRSFQRFSPACLFLLLLVQIGAVYATEKIAYQNWIVEIRPDTIETYTANDSNSSLGLFCGGTSCVFYLNPNLNCYPNIKNTILMNAATISAPIGMQCTLVGNHYFQILDSFDLVLSAAKGAGYIGFAVALQGGAFSVYRFSLDGASSAIQRALDLAASRRQVKPTQPLPNQQPGFRVITL